MSYGEIVTCREYWPAALQWEDGAYTVGLDLPVTNPPTEEVVTGSNQSYPCLRFPDAAVAYVRRWTRLPSDLYVPGGLALRLLWSTPATSGSVQWTAETAFVAQGDSLDPAFNAASQVIQAAEALSGALAKSDFTVLDMTGAEGGALLILQIGRDASDSDDVLADDVNLIGIELQYQRLVVLP